ncbi:MAG: sulfide/dihydroorotate dehydrogenase-like FAD/NAD-binding protein [Clostridia bacterium]|nr:sulfide/dihydroorotate dehydrogenase-like FAD/NAD-binding protein [Clostridia bacterium]
MFTITKRVRLNSCLSQITISAPAIAHKALAGQFVVLRIDEKGERIPLTISWCDKHQGTVTLIYQLIGNTTKQLDTVMEGDSILDLVGPLGVPTHIDSYADRVCVIGGGVGNAIAYPVAKAHFNNDVPVDVIAGYKNADFVILEDKIRSHCDNLYLVTDDGSAGDKGFVTAKLSQLLDEGVKYDHVFAIGPIIMMKKVCEITAKHNIKTTVSLNPIMVDGIGMCGGCRVVVGGQVKFACVDGPDFDGHLVDFDGLISRNSMYDNVHKCNLTGEVHK